MRAQARIAAGLAIVGVLLACGAERPAAEEIVGDPGRVTARRLNRAEYDNTVRELLGTELRLAHDFPSDDRAFGFDNVADALSVSSAHVELLEQATWTLVDDLFARHDTRVLSCTPDHDDPTPCVREIVRTVVPRAWRRPIDEATEDRFVAQAEAAIASGASVDDALRAVLATVMLSPQFLFRIERNADEPGIHPLDDFEVASRLSYFLWSSMPDDELFEAAANGELGDPDEVAAQVRRMLDDPRARALTDDFAGQWLAIRGIDDLLKDAYRYPAYDDALAAAMKAEMKALFERLLDEGRPIHDLLVADTGIVDARLAEHYDLEGSGEIAWGDAPRGGLLTTAGFLSVHSFPFTTSPVRRGRFVLEQLLCQPMGSPPPGIEMSAPSSQAGKQDESALRLENPQCAGCHAQMDPIGFGFEHYDPTGRWIAENDGEPIDAQGSFMGEPFASVNELAQRVADDPRFVRCAVQRTLGYALGRGVDGADGEAIDAITAAFVEADYDTRELFVLVATSTAFRYRRTE
jgi:hypothetical protein